jgi:tRNA(fMet)-specific endonuclease VapC
MKRYLLDTNIVSHLLRGHPGVMQRIEAVPMAGLCISAITEGELLFGLAKRPAATHLQQLVKAFLHRVDVLPWNSQVAACYGTTRAELSSRGIVIAPLDLLIAAHALSVDAVLVTNDQAFRQIDRLLLEDWTSP